MVRSICWCLATVAIAACTSGCNRGIDTSEAVRQGVIDYLAKRSNLNVSGMNVEVTSVSFRKNEADATVAFTARGANPGNPMSMRYTLERRGNQWVVKEKAESGANPHAGGGTPPQAAPGQMPPGHPPVDPAKPKP
jgi:hypothetical protein